MNNICEKCGKLHDGIYGSGRFCSDYCARSFSRGRKELGKLAPGAYEESRKSFLENLEYKYKNIPFEQWDIKRIKRIIRKEQSDTCISCNLKEWLDKRIVLELDHIDGDSGNNRRENLRMLCPNCHSQTPTWRVKNVGKKVKITEQELLDALNATCNIRQALLKVGLAPKGGNYARCAAICSKYSLQMKSSGIVVVKRFASVDQLAESTRLKRAQCEFESPQRHND